MRVSAGPTDPRQAQGVRRIVQNQACGPPSLKWKSTRSGRTSNRASATDSTCQPSAKALSISSRAIRRGPSPGGSWSLKHNSKRRPEGWTTLARPWTYRARSLSEKTWNRPLSSAVSNCSGSWSRLLRALAAVPCGGPRRSASRESRCRLHGVPVAQRTGRFPRFRSRRRGSNRRPCRPRRRRQAGGGRFPRGPWIRIPAGTGLCREVRQPWPDRLFLARDRARGSTLEPTGIVPGEG